MSQALQLHPDRLFPADSGVRQIARQLYESVKSLPIISPHGHTDASWFAGNKAFANPAELLIVPDHYLVRMLYSLGIPLESLGVEPSSRPGDKAKPREVWRQFAGHYDAFLGTPSRMWLDYVFSHVFELSIVLDADSADAYYDRINECLSQDAFLPRALFDRFDIELLATTESPLDSLADHDAIRQSDWAGRVITTYRPDPVVDPDYEGFVENLEKLSELTNEDTGSWKAYLSALSNRRAYFKERGATATDHGHPTALTAVLSTAKCQQLLDKALKRNIAPEESELFRAQMLTEMAAMSIDDGLVMQLHPGSFRNHNENILREFGRDKGADIPIRTEFVHALKPLLDRFANSTELTLILFTLDESTYSRELAPLAGHYPCLKLGPSWWFHDSPEGMRRFREMTTETAGFYNTVGFNDDTRAFMSIPARHDVARRMDSAYLARLVAEHRLTEENAFSVMSDLTYNLAKKAYKL